jgi:hypothetical protein
MRKLVLFVVIAAGAVAVGVAAAKAPLRAVIHQSFTFTDPILSSVCGQQVDVSVDGDFKATLFFDQSGNPIREVDTQPSVRLVYSAPSTGKSFSFPLGVAVHTDYANGVAPGAQATVTFTGQPGPLTGVLAPGAGRAVFDGVVLFVDTNGIPIVAPITPTTVSGNWAGQKAAKICAALA